MGGPSSGWTLGALVGSGGFAWTYELAGGPSSLPEVVKVLRPECAQRPQLVRWFHNEYALLRVAAHRHVVAARGRGMVDDLPAYRMERVDGVDLDHWRRSLPNPPSVAAVVAIGEMIASTLAELGRRRVGVSDGRRGELHLRHRDLKPSNIMLDRTGEVRLLDFGIARAELHELEGQTLDVEAHSPIYTAPERLLRQHDGPEADVYAIAVILVDLLGAGVGHAPDFGAPAHTTWVELQLQALPEATPGGFVQLLRDALAHDWRSRPTMDALSNRLIELEEAIGGVPQEELSGRTLRLDQTPDDGGLSGGVYREEGRGSATAWVDLTVPAPPTRRAALAGIAAALVGVVGVVAVSQSHDPPEVPEVLPVLSFQHGGDVLVRGTVLKADGTEDWVGPGGIVHTGDAVQFEVKTRFPATLVLAQQDRAGDAEVIYPPPGAEIRVAAGEAAQLPGGGDRLWMDAQVGEERLFVVASARPLDERALGALLRGPSAGPSEHAAVALPARGVRLERDDAVVEIKADRDSVAVYPFPLRHLGPR